MESIVEKLLAPISTDNSCGVNLDNHSELFSKFNRLEILLQGKPESRSGDSVIAEVKTNWSALASESEALLATTKDLRVAIYWANSQLVLASGEGLVAGMQLISGLLKQYWDTLYPALNDEDGDFFPAYRLNTLNHLASHYVCDMLKRLPLAQSKTLGKYNYRDYLIANGDFAPLNESESVPIQNIMSSFIDTDMSILDELCDQLQQVMAITHDILKFIEEKLPGNKDIDIDPFLTLVSDITQLLQAQLEERHRMNTDLSDNQSSLDADISDVKPVLSGNVFNCQVRSREEVVQLIEKICHYYQINEPSSPVPLILNRAKKIVEMDFLALIKDITPDSLDQVKKIAGLSDVDIA